MQISTSAAIGKHHSQRLAVLFFTMLPVRCTIVLVMLGVFAKDATAVARTDLGLGLLDRIVSILRLKDLHGQPSFPLRWQFSDRIEAGEQGLLVMTAPVLEAQVVCTSRTDCGSAGIKKDC
jgi:hypothetical protein